MADIDVVQRKGSSGWILWVVLALVAVAVVWMVMSRNGNQRDARLTSPAPATYVVAEAIDVRTV